MKFNWKLKTTNKICIFPIFLGRFSQERSLNAKKRVKGGGRDEVKRSKGENTSWNLGKRKGQHEKKIEEKKFSVRVASATSSLYWHLSFPWHSFDKTKGEKKNILSEMNRNWAWILLKKSHISTRGIWKVFFNLNIFSKSNCFYFFYLLLCISYSFS